jgi:hypothetical protein
VLSRLGQKTQRFNLELYISILNTVDSRRDVALRPQEVYCVKIRVYTATMRGVVVVCRAGRRNDEHPARAVAEAVDGNHLITYQTLEGIRLLSKLQSKNLLFIKLIGVLGKRTQALICLFTIMRFIAIYSTNLQLGMLPQIIGSGVASFLATPPFVSHESAR